MKRDRIETLKANAKLDVRLPDQLKDEFLARCREEGVSSGAVIRSLIIGYVLDRPRRWSTRLSWLKEAMMKRFRWVVGGIGGGLAAALVAGGALLAPAASADDMRVDYQLRFNGEGSEHFFTGTAQLGLNEGLITYPVNEVGDVTVKLIILPRPCHADALVLDANCEVAFQLHVFRVERYSRDEQGRINVENSIRIASFNLFGQAGRALNYSHVVDNDEPPLTVQIRATEL